MSVSCEPMKNTLPDSSVHGILQARILEWVAVKGIEILEFVVEQEATELVEGE